MKKNIISFDIGIRNLAFCLGATNSTDHWEIDKWGVLDLSGFKQPRCQTCEKNATFTFQNQHFCGKHCRATGGKPYPKGCTGNLMKKKLVELKTLSTELGLIEDGAIVKKGDIVGKLQEYLNTKCYAKITPPKAASIDMIDIGRQMSFQLDNLLKGTTVHRVLVENQIGTIATRMRTIQGMLYQYFIIRFPKAKILTISANNKLNVKIPDQVKSKIPEVNTSSYKDRKKSGIHVTKAWLENRGDILWLALFNKSKKKDDLADSLLQMIWYVQS